MWGFIANLFAGPIIGALTDSYKAKLAAGNTTEAKATELAIKEIEGQIEARKVEASILLAEQGWWVTAMIRPLFALPFIVFTIKVVVWDKVLGWGVTDALDARMWDVFMLVVGAYFGGRTIEKVARIFKR